MNAEGNGRCGRGRRRSERIIRGETGYSCLSPMCGGENPGSVVLRPDEIEVLRLVDLLGMQQEEAAQAMGISRKTLWRDLHEARKKVAGAIVNGHAILIEGCSQNGGRRCGFGRRSPD
ncbi:DUF134 domain-containing protein [Methanofollis fontis]|uniref:Uncharacterized protein n=1 Tax=Methanofollis fontis TaxID=2052832 RepID=A0A483CRY8_9EURY|nr:DUF134 domain-containing protein [Methanofollis fontis]TAJ43900.1 hypothetical protein CUJ86_07515 [Methanofollis fontis]